MVFISFHCGKTHASANQEEQLPSVLILEDADSKYKFCMDMISKFHPEGPTLILELGEKQ